MLMLTSKCEPALTYKRNGTFSIFLCLCLCLCNPGSHIFFLFFLCLSLCLCLCFCQSMNQPLDSVQTSPEEFKNGGFTLERHHMFSLLAYAGGMVSLWKGIKCFPSSLCLGNLQTKQPPVIVFEENSHVPKLTFLGRRQLATEIFFFSRQMEKCGR